MREKLFGHEYERILKKRRRSLLYLTAGTVFVVGGGLASGERMLAPDIAPRKINYEKEINNPFLGAVKIDFENFFNPDILYSHRAGNSMKDIDKAFAQGTTLFDIDVTEVNGELYGEHGYILEDILDTGLNLVFDPAEGEIRTKLPATFEELVRHIHLLSTSEKPLGISIDIKHGNFDKAALQKIVDIAYKFHVSAIIQPETKNRQTTLREIIAEKTIEPTLVYEENDSS